MKKWIFSLITCICMIPALSVSADMLIQVDYGVNGQGKEEYPLSVTITIENDEHTFEGELLTTFPNGYALQTGQVIPINLAPHEKLSESFVISAYPHQFYNDLQEPYINLYEGTVETGKKYKDYKIVNNNPKLYSYDSHVVGIISEIEVSKALQKLRAIEGNGLLEVQHYPLVDVQEVREARQLAFLNTIILTEPLSNFTEQQLQLFVEWIKDGGQFIVSGDVSSTPFEAYAALKGITGQSVASVQSLDKFTNEGLFGTELPLSKMQAFENTELFEVDGQLLAAKKNIGKGALIQTAFSLTDDTLLNSIGYANLLAEMLDLTTPYYKTSAQNEMANTVVPVNELFEAFEFSLWNILLVFIAYILIISPVLYFVLKKKDKREYAWGLIPLIAVIFSLGLFFIGAKDRIATPQIQQSAVVKIGETSQQYFVQSLLSNRSGDYQFDLDNDLNVSVYGNDFSRLTDFQNGRWSYVNEQKNELILKNVPYWDVETIVGQGSIDVGQFSVDVSNENGRLVGTITNDLTVDVTNLQIWTGTQLIPVGDIKRGETKLIDYKIAAAVLLPSAYPYNMTYMQPTPATFEKERYNRLLTLAQNVLANEQSPAILATAKELSYGAKPSKKAVMNSTALIVQPFTAASNFTDELTLLEQAFQVSFTSELYGGIENQLSSHVEDWYFDPGEYEVTYRLPNELITQPINWTTFHYEVDETIMKAKIFNVTTNQYESILGEFHTQDALNYIKQGEVRFQWEISEAIYNSPYTSPTIELKGVGEK
jgi:hypothetical protein